MLCFKENQGSSSSAFQDELFYCTNTSSARTFRAMNLTCVHTLMTDNSQRRIIRPTGCKSQRNVPTSRQLVCCLLSFFATIMAIVFLVLCAGLSFLSLSDPCISAPDMSFHHGMQPEKGY